jgi:hypothetical protein
MVPFTVKLVAFATGCAIASTTADVRNMKM